MTTSGARTLPRPVDHRRSVVDLLPAGGNDTWYATSQLLCPCLSPPRRSSPPAPLSHSPLRSRPPPRSRRPPPKSPPPPPPPPLPRRRPPRIRPSPRTARC